MECLPELRLPPKWDDLTFVLQTFTLLSDIMTNGCGTHLTGNRCASNRLKYNERI